MKLDHNSIDYEKIAIETWNDFTLWSKSSYSVRKDEILLKELSRNALKNKIIYKLIDWIDYLLSFILKRNTIKFRYHTAQWLQRWEDVRAYSEIADFASLGDENLKEIMRPNGRIFRSLNRLVRDFSASGNNKIEYLSNKDFLNDINSENIDHILDVIEFLFGYNISSFGVPQDAVVSSYNFLKERFDGLSRATPPELMIDGGFSKVIKVVIGVVFYSMSRIRDNDTSEDESASVLINAVKIGFYWGVTYPLVDNLFDSPEMNQKIDISLMSNLIISGISGEVDTNDVPDEPFIRELYYCCTELKKLVPPEDNLEVYNAIKLFYTISARDAGLINSKRQRTEQDIYIDNVMKAGLARICTAGLAGLPVHRSMVKRYFIVALHNQIEDNALDYFSDKRASTATAFTLFDNTMSNENMILSNPFIKYFQVNQYVASKIGMSNFDYAHRLLMSALTEMVKLHVIEEGGGASKLFIDNFCKENISNLKKHLKMLRKNWEGIQHISEEWPVLNFIDQHIGTTFNYYHVDFYKFSIRNKKFIEEVLLSDFDVDGSPGSTLIQKAMQHIIAPPAKRTRALLALASGQAFSIEKHRLIPLVKAIEFFHGASLAFDDLPSHDNASLRRGREATHLIYGEANTHLASIALIAQGFFELSQLSKDPEVNHLIARYAAFLSGVNGLCAGQAQDIENKQVDINLYDLVDTAKKKTGSAIAFSLLIPAIIANRMKDIPVLEKISMNIGIAYQIRDDILDYIGCNVGKDQKLDAQNNAKTFPMLLGIQESTTLFKYYINQSIHELSHLSQDSAILKGFLQGLLVIDLEFTAHKFNATDKSSDINSLR